jgi:replicative DNA helicase
MRKIPTNYDDNKVAERGVLARLVLNPDERSLVTAILEQADFELPEHRRLFCVLAQLPACIVDTCGLDLLELLHARADEEAVNLLMDLAFVPHPSSLTELLRLAVWVHDQAVYRELLTLEEKAMRDLLDDPDFSDESPPEDELGW